MKHAYLIIAHNEFGILKRLISLLDDERNDIYVHFDRKVREVPELTALKSRLYVLPDRIDVRWGTVRQIEVELLMMKTAMTKGSYDYYHIISGTHLPLKSQDFIHAYFDSVKGREVFRLWPADEGDADFKLRRFHFWINGYNNPIPAVRWLVQHVWTVNLRIQKMLGIRHYKGVPFYKSDNWISITELAVACLVSNMDRILKKYRYSFCGDEYFAATELKAGGFEIEDCPNLLYVQFVGPTPRTLSLDEYATLRDTEFLFARKFSEK